MRRRRWLEGASGRGVARPSERKRERLLKVAWDRRAAHRDAQPSSGVIWRDGAQTWCEKGAQ
eukprot:15477133-Alexandrium_andersonii.AAC.1